MLIRSLRYLDQNLYIELNGFTWNYWSIVEIRYFVYTNDPKFFTYNPIMNKKKETISKIQLSVN